MKIFLWNKVVCTASLKEMKSQLNLTRERHGPYLVNGISHRTPTLTYLLQFELTPFW